MKKIIASIICAGSITYASLTPFIVMGQETDSILEVSTEADSIIDSDTLAANEQTIGEIQKIEGNKITLLSGTLSEAAKPSSGNSNVPEKPEAPQSSASDKPANETEEITITADESTIFTEDSDGSTTEYSVSDLEEGMILSVTLNDNNEVIEGSIVTAMDDRGPIGQAPDGAGQGGPGGNGFGGSAEVTNGTAANTIFEDSCLSNETYISTGDDENALRVDNATVTLDGVTIEKAAGATSNTENGDFYGMNAGLLACNGATLTITGATVTTTAQNGNGIFSYGERTSVTISDSTIHTTNDNSGGIQTTGGASMNASNLTVETQGNSSAAIRTDRGGGNVTVNEGTYTSNGTGSPSVYSTANIAVSNATLTANNSEALVIEGKNSIALTDCTVTGNMSGTYQDDSENIHNVMIYQSMSGDANEGTSEFSMTGGSLTGLQGDMIYVTNTDCIIELSDVALTLANENLLVVEGNNSSRGWGTEGSNGGDAVFTANNQVLTGNITVDEISSLDMTMNTGSTYEGAVNPNGEAGYVSLTLNDSSTWTLTADSYLTSFTGDTANVNTNGYTLYVNGEAITE